MCFKINEKDNKIKLIFEDILPIKCLYKMDEKQMILCPDKQIKFHELNN